MSRVGVQTVVADLSLSQINGAAFARLYDEVLRDLLEKLPLGATATLVPVVAGTATYSLPSDAIQVLSYFWGDYGLDEMTEAGLPVAWRARHGRPQAVVTERELEREIRLFPTPNRASGDFTFLLGSPLGEDYPADALGIVATQLRENYDAALDLALGFHVIARYHSEDGQDRSPSFAKICKEMGNTTLAGLFPDLMEKQQG